MGHKLFLEGTESSRLFRSADHKSTYSYLNVHSDQPIKLKKSQVVSLLILVLFLHTKETPGKIHFSPVMFIKEGILSKIMCHSVTKCTRSHCTSSLLHFHALDLNP